MSKDAQRQIAICYLLLKGEHWIPVSRAQQAAMPV
jgi:hypothetical protein